MEHAESFKILLAAGNFTSSIGLLRLQFECLVRGMWIFYSATDIAVSKFTADLNEKNQNRASNSPMLGEMIKGLEKTAPENSVKPILEFKEYSLKPLNSYIHGGLHAVERHSKGYPVELLEQALKASNGVNGMIGVFYSTLTGQAPLVKEVYRSFYDFSDCFKLKINPE